MINQIIAILKKQDGNRVRHSDFYYRRYAEEILKVKRGKSNG